MLEFRTSACGSVRVLGSWMSTESDVNNRIESKWVMVQSESIVEVLTVNQEVVGESS